MEMKLAEFLGTDVCSFSADVKERLSKATYVGIDFGTSTTTVTRLLFDEDHQRVVSEPLPIAQESLDGTKEDYHLVPTVIAMKSDGHLLFGNGAKACLFKREDFVEGYNAWTCFKMRVGESACYPKTMMSKENTPVPGAVIETPKDAATQFFAYLKAAIEDAVRRDNLPPTVKYAITVPASFAPNQREELCAAVRDAGIDLDPKALLDEPNSAFMGAAAYHAEEGGTAAFFRDERDINALVFDFGAGTCDISLLRISRDGRMQNLAISHFTALGGRDLDERIAADVLYPHLVEGRSGDDVPVPQIRENIINKLRPVAERLKIALCDKYSHFRDQGESVFARAKSEPDAYVADRFSCPTRNYGVFEDTNLKLTVGDFVKIVESFCEPAREAFENGHKSIFDPVDEVMRKAGVSKDEIDFVLRVGGSAENPFVIERLEEYFPRTTQIVAEGDIRTLVARGAAIHSFAVNGIGQSFVRPITSEDILIKTSGGGLLVFAAGTAVPTEAKVIDGLYADARAAQSGVFGIPFYASVDERELGVARFDVGDIEENCEVTLGCAIAADKTLRYAIAVGGRRFSGTFAMPQSSESVPPEQLEYVKAKNDIEFAALANHGVPTVAQYKRKAAACEKIGKYEEAAGCYRDLMYDHRHEHFEADVARCFRAARKNEEALTWSRRACDLDQDYLNVWYLVWDLQRVKGWGDHETMKWLEYAIANWPDDLDFQFVEMRQLEGVGQKEEAKKKAEELCEAWVAEGVTSLGEYELERFEIVARICGLGTLVRQIREQLDMLRSKKARGGDKRNYSLVSSHACGEASKGE